MSQDLITSHEKINYIELPSSDLALTKRFFSDVFGWLFEDFGPEYCAFSNAGIAGGFYASSLACDSTQGSVLVVIYSKSLEQTQAKIERFGGKISQATFNFPGGRRFHFMDPNGNEYAVWSDT